MLFWLCVAVWVGGWGGGGLGWAGLGWAERGQGSSWSGVSNQRLERERNILRVYARKKSGNVSLYSSTPSGVRSSFQVKQCLGYM